MEDFMKPEVLAFDNDNAALIPELWAREALRTLGNKLVLAHLVNRDYSDDVSAFGDVVNTSRPADFSARRKTMGDQVTIQDAVSPNIPVPLDQHVHVSFVIYDEESSKSFVELVDRYLEPAAREMADYIDRVLCGQVVRLTASEVGRLNEMDKTNAQDTVLAANTQLDINQCPDQDRYLVLGPRARQACLGADIFVAADKRGDEGTALRTASLGSVYNFDTFMSQNMGYVYEGRADILTGATKNAEAAGSTTIETTVVDASLAAAGEYVVIEGEGVPHRVASSSDDTGATIVLTEGLVNAVSASAAVKVMAAGTADGANDTGLSGTTTYPVKWSKPVRLDGFTATKELQKGQWVTFGTGASSHSYTVVKAEVPSAGVSLVQFDRPLEAAVADGDLVFPGPDGGFNLALHRDALALVVRPLKQAQAGAGAMSAVVNYDGLAIRVTITYDGRAQGHLVTFDLLCGVAVLDERLATVVYS